MKFVKKLSEIGMNDVGLVGGKNASLGQMISGLSAQGVRIPQGFAVTSKGYWDYVNHNQLQEKIAKLLKNPELATDITVLKKIGLQLRNLFLDGTFSLLLEKEIVDAYRVLSQEYGVECCDVAVRSSATAEDLPGASFAGQQETFLHVVGAQQLLDSCKKSFASLFTDRAIAYRIEKGFAHDQVALSIGVQKMVRSDQASSGVAFSLDPQTGFKDVVVIESSYGLGEAIVQGMVRPDEFVVFKPTLAKGYKAIINKTLGDKKIKCVYSDDAKAAINNVSVPIADQQQFSIDDVLITELAQAVVSIEKYYSDFNQKWTPMDVEWAQDAQGGLLYIIQARPETVHSIEKKSAGVQKYVLEKNQKLEIVAQGLSVGQKIVSGPVRVIQSVDEIDQIQTGDIVVTYMSDPSWVVGLKKMAGIITQEGGRTCHAAIISRELGIPAAVGVQDIMQKVKTGEMVTLDCSQGGIAYLHRGTMQFSKIVQEVSNVHLPIDLMVTVSDPAASFSLAQLPVAGVGLVRTEFILSSTISVHPLAIVHPEKVTDEVLMNEIEVRAAPYDSLSDFFVQQLAYGIATIAAAFYPRPVLVRLSDFKSDEYVHLLGGSYFEQEEANPMLGLRGAARYCHPLYKDAFGLECAALKLVREQMGFFNISLMVPFVRTVQEGGQVLEELACNGLERGKESLSIYMMAEVPSNGLLIDDFCALFDGFSLGTNDLTQLTLGIDRNAAELTYLFNEQDPAVLALSAMVIEGARQHKKSVGACGQGPSDSFDFAYRLIEMGVTSLSLNGDVVIPFLHWYKKNYQG